MEEAADSGLWVFGYGSLCWMPGFPFTHSRIGHIDHFVRRFWQGNTTHRGVPGKPGRVATLVKEENGSTYGVAYRIEGDSALNYLNNREVKLGGYSTEVVTFHPQQGPSFPVLLYIATDKSPEWSGPAPLHEVADQIVDCSGAAGHNVEYLLRLAQFMREHIPEGYDEHLLTLEALVRMRVKEKKLCMKVLMGETQACSYSQEIRRDRGERVDTFQYTAKVPGKKLRCLNL